jgi:hypothetical protein
MSEREMTLEEWVNRLPEIHAARREYGSLRSRLAAADANDRRYRWLRQRLEIRNEHSMAAGSEPRPAMAVRIGCSFLDSPLPISSNPEHWQRKAIEVDASIDAHLAAAREGEK